MSLTDTDAAAAAVAREPLKRISLDEIQRSIVARYDLNGADMVEADASPHALRALEVFSLCLLVTRNGFVVVGKSAPAHPDNYDADLGKRFAYEDAIRQLWPLMGYALRDRLYADEVSEREAP